MYPGSCENLVVIVESRTNCSQLVITIGLDSLQ